MSRIVRPRRWTLLAVLALLIATLLSFEPTSAQSGQIIVDDASAGFSTDAPWTVSSGVAGAQGGSYSHDGSSGAEPGRWARWRPTIATAGYYQIAMRWPAHENRADAAPVTVVYDGGVDLAVRVNQQEHNNSWVIIGTYRLAAGSAGYVQIGAGDDGYTVADAIRLVPVSTPPAFVPTFQPKGVLLDPANLRYNPTGEIIFPSVIRAADYFSNPLGTYYLYYAPHDAPGGISLAYSNSLAGPWTEYANNPLIKNIWSPNYSVTHVSSPHVIWNAEEGRLFLYFHGENTTTRLATSTDGLSFSYGGVMVTTAMFDNLSEASYARVFRHTIPSKGNRYIMLLMGNNAGTRRIYLAWSNDGRSWTSRRTPLISPIALEGSQIAAPTFYPSGGDYYVVYHGDLGNMQITRVGANFDQEQHLGVFYDDPVERVAAPSFITVGTTTYMIHERGARLKGTISLAATGGAPRRFEAENLAANTSGDEHIVIDEAGLSGGKGTKFSANAVGDFVTYSVAVPAPGTYVVRLGIKRRNSRGIYQLRVGGAPLGPPADHYGASDSYEELNLGTVRFAAAGNHPFTFTLTGKNPSSVAYTLGIDYITLAPSP